MPLPNLTRRVLPLLCAASAAILPLLASAFVIPDKLVDGVYDVSFVKGSKGKQYTLAHYDMAEYMNLNVTAKVGDDRASLPISLVQCPLQHRSLIDYSHMEIAREMLGTWCEMYGPHVGGVVMAVFGNATWYLCEWNNPPFNGDEVRTCSRQEVGFVSKKLDQWCGPQRNGYVQMDNWGLDYGRSVRSQPICPQLEAHDRKMDSTLPVKQRHRNKEKGGSGLWMGDLTKTGKDAKGKWGGKGIGRPKWRGPKGDDKGTSKGKGRTGKVWDPKKPAKHKGPECRSWWAWRTCG